MTFSKSHTQTPDLTNAISQEPSGIDLLAVSEREILYLETMKSITKLLPTFGLKEQDLKAVTDDILKKLETVFLMSPIMDNVLGKKRL